MFRKNWPWTDYFNYHLLAMKESGLMERLYQRNLRDPKKSCTSEVTINRIVQDPSPISINRIFPLYVILLMGVAAALILLLIEKSKLNLI